MKRTEKGTSNNVWNSKQRRNMKCIKDLKVILRAMGFELQVNNDEKNKKKASHITILRVNR